MTVDFDLQGGEQVSDKLQKFSAALRGMPLVQAFREVLLWITGDAKRFAPVDTGRLRASITPEVKVAQVAGSPVQGIVGSNVEYAPFQEFGTKQHFVPAKYIGTWAERHGFGYTGLIVSGKAKAYLRKAIEKNKDKLPGILMQYLQQFAEGND